MFLLATLLACAPSPESPVAGTTVGGPAAPWFYADFGDAIDWSTVAVEAGELSFRTLGGDLGSGELTNGDALAEALACGGPTRLTVGLRDGAVQEVWTFPAVGCVERAARSLDWSEVAIGAMLVGDVSQALLVLDVPAPRLAAVAP